MRNKVVPPPNYPINALCDIFKYLRAAGTLYVLEQLPGTIEFQDKTAVLSGDRYWPSYNTPYYPNIFNLSGSQVSIHAFIAIKNNQ